MAVFGPRHRPLVIPAATIDRIGAKLLAEGRIRRGYLGLGLQALRLDEALTQAHALSDRRGIMVVSLDPTGLPVPPGCTWATSSSASTARRWRGAQPARAAHAGEHRQVRRARIVRAGQIATAKVTIGASPTP